MGVQLLQKRITLQKNINSQQTQTTILINTEKSNKDNDNDNPVEPDNVAKNVPEKINNTTDKTSDNDNINHHTDNAIVAKPSNTKNGYCENGCKFL